MDAEIIYDNGERFKLSDLSVEVTDFKVSSMVKQSVYEDIEGANRVDYGAEYKHRTISIPFVMTAYDLHDFAHLRNAIFAKVDSLESFYIREMRRPIRRQYDFVDFNEKPKEREGTDDHYVDGKQYRVRLVNVIEIEQRGVKGDGVLVFETTESPYAQSVYTSLELHDSGYIAGSGTVPSGLTSSNYQTLFGSTGNSQLLASDIQKLERDLNILKRNVGRYEGTYGLVDGIDDEKVKYRFTDNNFTVYNFGSVAVEPESMMLNITIGYVENTETFRLENKTTGDVFEINKHLSGRNIYLRGVTVTEGGATNIFRETNKRFLSLAPGNNEFEVTGGSFSQISFDFRGYYK